MWSEQALWPPLDHECLRELEEEGLWPDRGGERLAKHLDAIQLAVSEIVLMLESTSLLIFILMKKTRVLMG